MEWIPNTNDNSGVDINDKPRYLTEEEINNIVSYIPYAPSAESYAAEVNRKEVIRVLIDILREIKLCPSAIPELILEIIKQHNNSIIAAGTPVGIIAAEAVGSTTTQMTLNSVAPWEKILIINKKGEGQIEKIGEWIDYLLKTNKNEIKYIEENRTEYLELKEKVEIPTPDKNGNVSWDEITAITRHLPVGDLVKITTKSGRKVTATQSKSLLVWEGNQLIQREGKHIKVGDLVPILYDLPNPTKIAKTLNMRKYLPETKWLYVSELNEIYHEYKLYKGDKKEFWQEKKNIRLPNINGDAILRMCHSGLDNGYLRKNCIYPKNWINSRETCIPEHLILNKQLGIIMGVYLIKGKINNNGISINDVDEKVKNITNDWSNNFGIKCTKGESGVTINSVVLANLFKQLFKNNEIAVEILLANKEFIIGLLYGYFISNGGIKTNEREIALMCNSKNQLVYISYLCSRIGIFGEKITCGQNFKYLIKNIVKWTEVIGVPERKSGGNGDYETFNDVMLDPIVSVELIKYDGFVYDLTVPTTKNFSLLNGLGCADTFHTSGSSKSASVGISAMKELIFARKNVKNETCTIHFTNKALTYEEVLDLRKDIVGSVISDFITDYDIKSPDNLTKYWWDNVTPILTKKVIPESTQVLRLSLNVPEMYKHRVTIERLVEVLEREIPPGVICNYGPLADGIIDVYPDPALISETIKDKQTKISNNIIPINLAELTYLESIVVSELSKIRVKGIAGIRNIYPIVTPVWSMVILERKVKQSDLTTHELQQAIGNNLEDAWLLFCNNDVIKSKGITVKNLNALCIYAGCTSLGGNYYDATSNSLDTNNYNHNLLIIKMPNDRFRSGRGEILLKHNGHITRQIPQSSLLHQNNFYFKEINSNFIKENGENYVEEVDDKLFINVNSEDILTVDNKIYKKINNDGLIKINGDFFEILKNSQVNITELKPGEYVAAKVAYDKNFVKAELRRLNDLNLIKAKSLPEIQRRNLLRTPVTIPRTNLMKAAEFIIAETEGSNLRELLSLPGVDKKRTICNNMFTIAEILGIEAARTYLISALHNTISNTGSYVHPANILFIAEFITSRGVPYGATYTGISRQPGGHLSLATLERAGTVFTESALHGKKEDIRNVSASVALGSRVSIGSGSFDIAQNINQNGFNKIVINDDLFTAIENNQPPPNINNSAPWTAEQSKINIDELLTGIDSFNIGGFDETSENETNLLTLFNDQEIIPDATAPRPSQPVIGVQPVKRVSTNQHVSQNLVDVLSQLKIGIPLPDLTAPVSSLSLETTQQSQPFISSGFDIPANLTIPPASNQLPSDLLTLLNQYTTGPLNITQDLPSINPRILTGLSANNYPVEIYNEQIRNLQPSL